MGPEVSPATWIHASLYHHWYKDACIHAFMLFGSKYDPTIQMLQQKSGTVLFCFFVQMQWSYANCSLFPVLSCGLPIKGSTWCAFRDAFLHTMVLTSGYLSYHCLSICLSQSAHSLTSKHQQGLFSHRSAAHWIFSFLPWQFFVNPRYRKIPFKWSVSEILSSSHLSVPTMPCSKSHLFPL